MLTRIFMGTALLSLSLGSFGCKTASVDSQTMGASGASSKIVCACKVLHETRSDACFTFEKASRTIHTTENTSYFSHETIKFPASLNAHDANGDPISLTLGANGTPSGLTLDLQGDENAVKMRYKCKCDDSMSLDSMAGQDQDKCATGIFD